MHFKDEILDRLAQRTNVAQFVSFSPELKPRYARISDPPIDRFASLGEAAEAIILRSPERSINIRSFHPADAKSREFIYGVRSSAEAEAAIRRLAAQGLYTILNETVDIHDGGVSGVVLGDVVEFAPDDTPRCVEKPGTAAFPRDLGTRFLETVYGFAPDLDFPRSTRVEFSLHPIRRGVRRSHQLVWELEEVGESEATADIRWPNRFSELIGDKVFGLIVAHLFDLPVPHTTVISRRLAPFEFGRATGTSEPWIRTSPRIQIPGKFTTQRGWRDPFELVGREDPSGTALASVLFQEGVDATFSGAVIAHHGVAGPVLTIEGVEGFGDEFMTGSKQRTQLPESVRRAVKRLYEHAFGLLGYVRFEWVAAGNVIWIVQLHRGESPSHGRTIYPGNPSRYVRFDVNKGLEALRAIVAEAAVSGAGIELVGDVGITSHFGDILRKAKVPSLVGE